LKALLRLAAGIDWLCAQVGRAVAWLILVAVIVSAGNAAMRKAFDISSNSWLELQWYLFSAAFLLAAAYTLQRNEHIRIDIVSGVLSKRARDWIDLLGHLFMLMPFVVVMLMEAVPFLETSFRQREMSANAGGLIIWPAKALIVAGFALLFIQGVSEIVKRVAVMLGVIPDPLPDHHAHPAVEEMMAVEERRHD
jgi:TRAP-type mannitol/chloroaromatic compound transport system permease small subunit